MVTLSELSSPRIGLKKRSRKALAPFAAVYAYYALGSLSAEDTQSGSMCISEKL